jgi:hypothetical protein
MNEALHCWFKRRVRWIVWALTETGASGRVTGTTTLTALLLVQNGSKLRRIRTE